MLKSALSVFPRYYVGLPLEGTPYLSLALLAQYGVNLHSSTPRIYGYVQYIMRKGLLPQATDAELEEDRRREEMETEVDVPQHVSIGRVKSWQIDGAETWESYSREDTEMLVALGESYRAGADVAGVVLNDLGTIYQEGIGVERDGQKAEYWFKQAYLQGDHLYAPTNLGDLYRKGCGTLPVSLPQAFEAYKSRKISMPFIASDKPMKKGGLAHRTGRKRCTGIGKLPRKTSLGSPKTRRVEQPGLNEASQCQINDKA